MVMLVGACLALSLESFLAEPLLAANLFAHIATTDQQHDEEQDEQCDDQRQDDFFQYR